MPDRFTIERCGACGVLRTTPVPPDLAPYYATDLAATMTHAGSALFAALRRLQLARELRRITRHGDPGTLLDVGCGVGDFVLVAHRRGLRVVAADVGTPPAALAGTGVSFVRVDFETLEFEGALPPEPFTVILRHVLEHVRDPLAFLTRLRRLGARQFYVVVPNAASREARLLGASWYLWDPPRHLWHFERDTLARLCARAGLAPVAAGLGTAPTLLPSLYRGLRLRGWPSVVYDRFGPTSLATAALAPVNALLPGNVLWLVAR